MLARSRALLRTCAASPGTLSTAGRLVKNGCRKLHQAQPGLAETVQWAGHDVPAQQASMPPNSWYVSPEVLALERRTTFRHNWLPVGHADQLRRAGDYITGVVVGEPYFIVRGDDMKIRGFHNVCRHRAARLLTSAAGNVEGACVKCPYHGWEYRLDGRLAKAPKLGGAEAFKTKDYGLLPVQIREWGPLLFLKFYQSDNWEKKEEQLGPLRHTLDGLGFSTGMRHVTTRTYDIACNWKVFADNYLDGGYHVSLLHGDLAAGLDLSTYDTQVFDGYTTQTCSAKATSGRVSGTAVYAYVHPNLMINRYGPWLDTNVVYPLDEKSCRVRFDYWLAEDCSNADSIAESLACSDKVQQEDIEICENVQVGLSSSGYVPGRYAPRLERGDHAFHRQLYTEYTSAS